MVTKKKIQEIRDNQGKTEEKMRKLLKELDKDFNDYIKFTTDLIKNMRV